MAHKVVTFLVLLAVYGSAEKQQTRWSRQISSYTSDISDWVPLPGPVERELPPIKRQAVAEPRILSEPFPGFVRPAGFSQDSFPSRAFYNAPANRQLYLQSVPSAPQNYLSDQGFSQGLRFGLTQPNFPLSQGFIAPQFDFDGVPQVKPRPQSASNPIKFENSIKHNHPISPPNLHSQLLKSISQAQKPENFLNSKPLKPETPKFVDGYRVENNTDYSFAKKKHLLSQKVKFDNTDTSKESYSAPKTKVEREEVQLLYVPLDTLNRGQFNFRSPLTSAQLLNTELYNQNSGPNPLMQNLAAEFQGPAIKQVDSFNSQEFVSSFNGPLREVGPIPKFSTITTPFATAAPTTPKPKKLKPHQPPLAVFLSQDVNKEDQVKVGDVLNSLKNVKTVPVLDSVNPLNAPDVFIGPSSLSPPETYVKFELPYLSNIDNSDKKLKQLPFFVAPLSYNTPQGFAKIPFPSPHVGSVVINSLIKDSPPPSKATTATNFFTHSYSEPIYRQEQKPVTQKPKISYYSTSSPNTNSPTYEQSYYSIEPQSVSTLRPFKGGEPSTGSQMTPIKSSSYFLSNLGNQYKPGQYVNFPQDTRFKAPEAAKTIDVFKLDSSTTARATTTTTKAPVTPPSQLLDTHNPYSINQAFHFSTPLDYHNFFDEYKEPYVTPEVTQSPSTIPITPAPELTTNQESEQYQPQLNRPTQQSLHDTQNKYNLQKYIPEIRHESDIKNLNYPVYNTNNYPSKTELIPETQYSNSNNPSTSSDNILPDTNSSEETIKYSQSLETTYENYTNSENVLPESFSNDVQSTKSPSDYNNYDVNYNSQETQSSTMASTSTTASATRRSPIRSRGRPRYPTTKSDSSEFSTRATITRRPLRERKPLPVRSKYEPNKITSELQIKNQYDSSESTTKSSRTRTRGRVHYKPSENDEHYTRRHKQNGKEDDLAYQRDVLHQNYPVTLMERTSTADIEAITEPSAKSISTNNLEASKTYDTEDAYSNDKLSITEPVNGVLKDLSQQHTTAIDSVSDAPYLSKVTAHYEDFAYDPQSSKAPQETELSNEEVKEDNYSSHERKTANDFNSGNPVTEQNIPSYSINDEFQSQEKKQITIGPDSKEDTNIENHDISHEQEQEENIVETTPSYNRVRIRPGVIRQYHQSSTTESSKRKKPLQAITYRPAFDKRRTTMRIEEIEADLKTKQIHTRPEYQDYKQPVYKPEPSTESATSTTETTTTRSQLRRRRPTYVSSSTESTVTRRTYEIKNRFRGRRPTEKPVDKVEVQTEGSTAVKNNVYSRYSHRPRLSERYNKKSEVEDLKIETEVTEDQDSNYSINRPKYAAPDSDRWSPKISKDSFKPFNPNNIADDTKEATNIGKLQDADLDIITARNEFEDILISVTPATNNRVEKKIADIPPTLEALVEQSKVTKSDSSENMSTFESMLEEVMKNLEEQDENEYTGHVMKHKGGEIGEIPPEKIISSGENYSFKSTTPLQEEITTATPDKISSLNVTEELPNRKNHRRGFWKRVKKIRPASEEIEVAESQYYSNVVNRLGQTIAKNTYEKIGKGNAKVTVTTYKPNYQFLKDFFAIEEEQIDAISEIDIPKINSNTELNTAVINEQLDSTTKSDVKENPTESVDPGNMDLGTGSPDPTLHDRHYYSDPTEPTSASSRIDRSDGFSFMDYLFGVTASDDTKPIKNDTYPKSKIETTTVTINKDTAAEADLTKLKATTESTYIPEEITELAETSEATDPTIEIQSKTTNNNYENEFQGVETTKKFETTSESSFMDPNNIVSTSMSTEISHETEICFRGKCIKTNEKL